MKWIGFQKLMNLILALFVGAVMSSDRPSPVPTIFPTPAFGVAPSLSCYLGTIGVNMSSSATPIAYQPAGLSFATHSCVSYCQYCKNANDTGFFSCQVGSTVQRFEEVPNDDFPNIERNPQVSDLQICKTSNCNSPSSFTGSCKVSSSSNGTNRYVADGATVVGVCVAILFVIIFGSVLLRRRHFQLASQSAAVNKAKRGETDLIPVPSPLRDKTTDAAILPSPAGRLQPAADQRDQDL